MARLRNIQSGAVVSAADETAARLGSEWEDADKATAKKATSSKKKAASKKATSSDSG